mgnify:CR=1
MWKNATNVLKRLKKVIPISEAYLLGSFTTVKRRPADVDFIILLKTKSNKKENWSFYMVVSPDNQFGQKTVSDAKKWMAQKYGKKKSAVIKLI